MRRDAGANENMKGLTQQSAAILEDLIAGLNEDNRRRKIDNAPRGCMPVVVELIGERRWSVAHYMEMNGDRIADPDVEFVRQDGRYIPVAIQHPPPFGYHSPVKIAESGRVLYTKHGYDALLSFAETFLRNIKAEQRDLRTQPTASAVRERQQ